MRRAGGDTPQRRLPPWKGRGMTQTPVSLLERLRQPDDQDAWQRFVEL
jgi:hypothetical protein